MLRRRTHIAPPSGGWNRHVFVFLFATLNIAWMPHVVVSRASSSPWGACHRPFGLRFLPNKRRLARYYGDGKIDRGSLIVDAKDAEVFRFRGGADVLSPPTESEQSAGDATSTADAEELPSADNATNPEELLNTTTAGLINITNLVFGPTQTGDGSEADPDGIPERFIRMQKGNRQQARDAYVATVQWRLENDVDTILSRAHPRYDICKKIFPHYFAGRDPSGYPIVVQRPGQLDFQLAHEQNISMDDLLFHYVFVLEYCWNILEPGPSGVMTSVVDMTGVSLRKCFAGEMREFIQKSIGVISENYPQRSHRTLVINAPGWFGKLFKIIKPLLRESTREKIAIFNAGAEQDKALAEALGDALPAELVVGTDVTPKGADEDGFEAGPKSIHEHDIRQLALAVLNSKGEEMATC